MNKNGVIAVIVVIVLMVAAVGALALIDNSEVDAANPTGRLLVYGNANNDDFLNESDVDFIQDIVDGNTEWNPDENPYADTNTDGVITQDDVDLLKQFIQKESGVTMYYTDSWNGISSVNYPVTGTIGTMYWEAADLAILLGLWPRVIACGSGSLTELKNPGWEDLISYGLGYDVDPETVIASGVDSLITYNGSDGTAAEIKAFVEAAQADVQVICLPSDFSARVAVAGVLYQCEEKSEAWMRGCDEVMEYMEEQLQNIDSSNAPKILTIMLNSSSDLGNIRILGPSTSTPHGLFKYLSMTPADVAYPDDWDSYYTVVDIEWIHTQDPDYIVFVSSGAWPSSGTDEEIDNWILENCEQLFGETRAYQNGNIIATANGTMGSFQAGYAFIEIISYIFDEIDRDYAHDMYSSYYDDFTYYALDQYPSYKIRYLGDII